MGLFSRRRGPKGHANSDAEARAIAAYALVVAFADQRIAPEEIAEIHSAAAALPAFRKISGKRLKEILHEVVEDLSARGTVKVLEDANKVLPPALREITFYIAVRVAHADGVIDGAENTLLIELSKFLGLSSERSIQIFSDATIGPGKAAQNPSATTGKDQGAQASEQAPKRPSFDAYVLLSEPLQFTADEILDALKEDFPELDITPGAHVMGQHRYDTDGSIMAPLLMGSEGEDAAMALLMRVPKYGNWDADALEGRQKRQVPDLDLRLERNASYICISVVAASLSLTDRFRAARLSSCLAAVFARLPVALAVYWEQGDHFLAPQAVIAMADEAMKNKWPLMSWLSLELVKGPQGDTALVQASTRGLAAFADYELLCPIAPVDHQQAASLILTTAWMVLEGGHIFGDGDTIGDPGRQDETAYRVRHLPKEITDSDMDLVAVIHPESPFDVDAIAGPLKPRTRPDGTRPEISAHPEQFGQRMRGEMRLS